MAVLGSQVSTEGKNGWSQITPARIVGHIRYCVWPTRGGGGGGALRTTESDHRRREKECLSRATEDSNHSVSKEVGLNWRGSCPPRGHLAMSGYGHSRELLVGM